MLKRMYGDWETFCTKRNKQYDGVIYEGLVGANIMMTRSAISKLGLWDERIQSADLDLGLRIEERQSLYDDIKSCHIIAGAFMHHFNRMTVKYGPTPPPFKDIDKLISIKEKWDRKKSIQKH